MHVMDTIAFPSTNEHTPPTRCEMPLGHMPSITVSFCTRNRESDLSRAIQSVLAQSAEVEGFDVTLMIVDDGDLSEEVQRRYARAAGDAKWRFHYFNKKVRGGLFRSRIETIHTASTDIVLFFDDDVAVEHGYLLGVIKRFAEQSTLSGLGGIDVLTSPVPLWRRLYEYVILYRATSPGRLSITGYSPSADRWMEQESAFDADFLWGCNMAYRRVALLDMKDSLIFEGHATGEDLYLAAIAARHGRVMVDPALRIRHYHSPLARDQMDRVFFRQIVNHYRILEDLGASPLRRWLVVYTAVGLVGLAAVRCLADVLRGAAGDQWPRLRGGLRGLRFVLTSLMAPAKRTDTAR